tara:strand:- start:250 stop:549 length:300 start_codon:yes stop_codon:yes gene_type:complete
MENLIKTIKLDSSLFMTFASLAPYMLIFLILYFMMIRPQVKQQKELTNMLNALKKGDNVITKGGIYGKIINITDTNVVVDAGNNTKINILRSAIVSLKK